MIWFGIFIAGFLVIGFGLIQSLRSSEGNSHWLGGGLALVGLGCVGFSTWPPGLLPAGMTQKQFFELLFLQFAPWALLAWALCQLLWTLRTLTWPRVTATIRTSEVVPLTNSGHAWRVSYSYTVNGQNYASTRKDVDIEEETISYSSASQSAKQYPVGKPVTVYYHPRDPGFAILHRSFFMMRWFMPTVMAAALLWAAHVF